MTTVLEWSAKEGRVLLTHDISTLVGLAFKRVVAGKAIAGVVGVPADLSAGAVADDLVLLATASINETAGASTPPDGNCSARARMSIGEDRPTSDRSLRACGLPMGRGGHHDYTTVDGFHHARQGHPRLRPGGRVILDTPAIVAKTDLNLA